MRLFFSLGLGVTLLGCAPELARGAIGDVAFTLVDFVYLAGPGATDSQVVIVGSSRRGLCEALSTGTGRKRETTLVFTLAQFSQGNPVAVSEGTFTVAPTHTPALTRVATLLASRAADDSCSNVIPSWAGGGRGGDARFSRTTAGLSFDYRASVGDQNDVLEGDVDVVPCGAPTRPVLERCE